VVNISLGINQVFVTLSERVELASPVFLVRITSQSNSKDSKIARLIDLSIDSDRVNSMTLTVVDSAGAEDLDNGIIHLTDSDYIYEFFESTTAVLNVDGLHLLEMGFIRYDTDHISTEYTPPTTNEITYNG